MYVRTASQSKSIVNDKFFDRVLIISFLNVSRFQNSCTIDTDLAKSTITSKMEVAPDVFPFFALFRAVRLRSLEI